MTNLISCAHVSELPKVGELLGQLLRELHDPLVFLRVLCLLHLRPDFRRLARDDSARGGSLLGLIFPDLVLQVSELVFALLRVFPDLVESKYFLPLDGRLLQVELVIVVKQRGVVGVATVKTKLTFSA